MDTSRQKVSQITLDTPVLQALDGTPFIHIGNMMYMGKQITHMLSKKPCIYCELEDTYTTVRELRQLEKAYEDAGYMTSDIRQSLDRSLKQALDMFADISRPYVEEIKAAKGYMLDIIENWSTQRNRKDTYLREWANLKNEEEALYIGIDSFNKFEGFLDDLSTFLADLIQNCPKSYQQFKQEHS